MSIQLIVKAGSYPNFVTELKALPTTIEIEQSKGFKSLIGIVVILLILLFILGSAAFIIAIIAAVMLYFTRGFAWFFAPNTMTFDRHKVTITEFSLLKKHHIWEEHYRSFEGVFLNQEAQKDANGVSIDYITMELQHTDPEKTLPLYAKQKKKPNEEVYDRLKQYANIFNLPAFD